MSLYVRRRRRLLLAGALCGLALLPGCTREGKFQPVSMWNESRLKPYEASVLPGRASASRHPVAGTIARGQLASTDPKNTGRDENRLLRASPIPITRERLARGQDRFNIACSPCHGRLGDGQGMAAKRGFPHPPDYAIRRLRDAPLGHFFDVMTNGYGVMYSQAERIAPSDRWAIAAYIRVLQETRKEVPPDNQREKDLERARGEGIVDPARGQRLLIPGREQEGAHPTTSGAGHGDSGAVPPGTGAAPHAVGEQPTGAGAPAPTTGGAAAPATPGSH